MKNLYHGFIFLIIIFSSLKNLNAQCVINPLTPTDIVFVKETGSGDLSGTSWDNAMDGRLLAAYLRTTAVNGTAIYVAAGTYYTCNPVCGDTARTRYFEINDNISLKGGYGATSAGTDTSDTNRDMKANVTRLSAEYQQDGDNTNNSYHVVFIKKLIGITFGGFYISDGYAFPSIGNNTENGGGIFCDGQGSPLDPNVAFLGHLVIENNTANYGGGIYFNQRKASIADNIVVLNNVSKNGNGGGIFAWGDFALFNSTVSGNTGNAITSWKGDVALRNSTITGNTGTGIYVTNGPSNLKLRLRIISSTITNNGNNGVRMDNHLLDSMTLNLDNSLIVNNVSNGSSVAQNLNFSGAFPINIIGFQFSIAGDSIFENSREEQTLLPIPVALDVLAPNGGWGDTRALLDVCNNPAVGAGDVSLLSDTVVIGDTIFVGAYTNVDQRGVTRDNPPCIGAYDGVRLLRLTNWTGTINSDWNNVGNWDNGIPMECSHVSLPNGTSNYPVIDGLTNAICDTIDFGSGAEIGGAPFLTYNFVRSDMEIQSNRWYTLSAPLTEMFSGDYILSPTRLNPAVYMMQYQTQNPQTGVVAVVGGWSNPFSNMDVPLTVGQGFAVWVDHDPTENVVFNFPKLDSRYYFYDRDGNQLPQFVDLSRPDPGQFIYKNLLSSEKLFSFPVDHSLDPGYISLIIGNPFLSHLDFVAFYNNNTPRIENKFQIWKGGTSFESYIIDESDNVIIDTETGSDGGINGLMIPPMQSILVTKAQPFTQVNFTPEMSVTQPGIGLRNNTLASTTPNVLKLDISVDGQRQSGIAIRLKSGANNAYRADEDVWTAFPSVGLNSAILYSLIDDRAASINTLNNASVAIELGIRKKGAGRFTLNTFGLESFGPDYTIYLEDRQTQLRQNLQENPSYTFDTEIGDVNQRFYILVEKSATSLDGIESQEPVLVYSSTNNLYITASLNSVVHSIEVFGTQGQLLVKKDQLNDSPVVVSLPPLSSQPFLIVKVITSGGNIVRKIMLD